MARRPAIPCAPLVSLVFLLLPLDRDLSSPQVDKEDYDPSLLLRVRQLSCS